MPSLCVRTRTVTTPSHSDAEIGRTELDAHQSAPNLGSPGPNSCCIRCGGSQNSQIGGVFHEKRPLSASFESRHSGYSMNLVRGSRDSGHFDGHRAPYGRFRRHCVRVSSLCACAHRVTAPSHSEGIFPKCLVWYGCAGIGIRAIDSIVIQG